MKTNNITMLAFMLFLISIICLGITGGEIFKIFKVTENLNAVGSNKALWEIIIRSIGSIGTIILGITIFLIFNNVRRKLILHRKNVLILKASGALIIFIGTICLTLNNLLLPIHTIETARYLFLVIIGGCLHFFSYVLEMGIQLQEEQNLTI